MPGRVIAFKPVLTDTSMTFSQSARHQATLFWGKMKIRT